MEDRDKLQALLDEANGPLLCDVCNEPLQRESCNRVRSCHGCEMKLQAQLDAAVAERDHAVAVNAVTMMEVKRVCGHSSRRITDMAHELLERLEQAEAVVVPCEACDSTGEYANAPCNTCGGERYETAAKVVERLRGLEGALARADFWLEQIYGVTMACPNAPQVQRSVMQMSLDGRAEVAALAEGGSGKPLKGHQAEQFYEKEPDDD